MPLHIESAGSTKNTDYSKGTGWQGYLNMSLSIGCGWPGDMPCGYQGPFVASLRVKGCNVTAILRLSSCG